MLLLVIAAALVVIAVALLPQAVTVVVSALTSPLGALVAIGLIVVVVAVGVAIAVGEAWSRLPGRAQRVLRASLGLVLAVVCFFYAVLLFLVPFTAWDRQEDLWPKVLVGLFVWGMGAAFAYGGWRSVLSLVLGRGR
jgi:hypothetical protein